MGFPSHSYSLINLIIGKELLCSEWMLCRIDSMMVGSKVTTGNPGAGRWGLRSDMDRPVHERHKETQCVRLLPEPLVPSNTGMKASTIPSKLRREYKNKAQGPRY